MSIHFKALDNKPELKFELIPVICNDYEFDQKNY